MIILFLTLICHQNVFGDNTVRLYCFQGENLKEVSSYLKPILKTTDSISAIETTNCLEIHLSSVRIPLFDSWLSRRYKFKNDFKNVLNTKRDNLAQECRLELIKKSKATSEVSSGSIGKNSNLKIQKTSAINSSRSRFLMTTGKPFSFQVNDQSTFITCHRRDADNYKVRISLSDTSGALETSVSLIKGGEVNIGSIVENLNKKRKSADLSDGIDYNKTNFKQRSDYTLKIY